ncbi:hypothetical protein BLA29_013243, partial [Euroglyphus maynei]
MRKLRPQSVMDGSVVPNEDFSELINRNSDQSSNDTSLQCGNDLLQTKPNLHLTKMRPRNRKIRAPTRVIIVDSKTANNKDQQIMVNNPSVSKLDEGLEKFFPTISLTNNSSSN